MEPLDYKNRMLRNCEFVNHIGSLVWEHVLKSFFKVMVLVYYPALLRLLNDL